MVEQTGSVFMSCPYGVLHENALATIIARDARNIFKEVKMVQKELLKFYHAFPKLSRSFTYYRRLNYYTI